MDIIETIKDIASVLGCLSVAGGLSVAIVKPIKTHVTKKAEAKKKEEEESARRIEHEKQLEEKLNTLTSLLAEHIANDKISTEAQLCSTRASITDKYYRYKKGIPVYQRESLIKEYECYHAMNGNTYVDTIYPEMLQYPVIDQEDE